MITRIQYALITAWLAIVSISYLAVFPVPELIAGLPHIPYLSVTGAWLKHFLILCLFFISASGWGGLFLLKTDISRIERLLFSWGLGAGLIMLTVFIAGVSGVPGKPLYFGLLVSGALLFAVTGKLSFFTSCRSLKTFLLLSSPAVVSSIIGALAPPTQFDSLAYHLALPARYLANGIISARDGNFFFSFPQNMEMLYLFAVTIDNDILANLLHWIFMPLTGLAILSFCRRFAGAREGIIAALIWSFTPLVLFLATGTYVDLAVAFFIFLSFYALMLARESGRSSWIVYAGIFTGLAAGTKYTALAAGLVLFVILIFEAKTRRGAITSAVFFAIPGFLVFIPWLIKNIVFLKNPVAPFFTNLFAGSVIAAAPAAGYISHVQSHGLSISGIRELIFLPWQLTAYGFRFGGAFDITGALFLLFIPCLFLPRQISKMNPRNNTKLIAFFTIGYFAVWLMTGKVMRFLLPVIPFLCLLSAGGLLRLTAQRFMRAFAYALLIIMMAHNLLIYHWTMAAPDPYTVVLGNETRDSYLSKKLNYYNALNKCVNGLGAPAKILFVGETRRYYCNANALVPSVFDEHPLQTWANNAATPRQLAATLNNQRITHVFINRFEYNRLSFEERFTARGKENWETLLVHNGRQLFEDKHCRVYELIY